MKSFLAGMTLTGMGFMSGLAVGAAGVVFLIAYDIVQAEIRGEEPRLKLWVEEN